MLILWSSRSISFGTFQLVPLVFVSWAVIFLKFSFALGSRPLASISAIISLAVPSSTFRPFSTGERSGQNDCGAGYENFLPSLIAFRYFITDWVVCRPPCLSYSSWAFALFSSLIEGGQSGTSPPSLNLLLFIASNVLAPIFLTDDFLITNSPGCNMAGTLSVFPVPGTKPPLAKRLIFPPYFLVSAPGPKALANPPIIPAIFMPASMVNIGSGGVRASAT